MISQIQTTAFNLKPLVPLPRPKTLIHASRQNASASDAAPSRRSFVLVPSISIAAAGFLLPIANAAIADEKLPEPPPPPSPAAAAAVVEEKKEEAVVSRVYDASVIGEPQAVGKDKGRVWDKLLGVRVVYLGEAELVPDKDDRELELEIVRSLRSRCLENERPVSLAMEAFPCNLQEQLDQFVDGRLESLEVMRKEL